MQPSPEHDICRGPNWTRVLAEMAILDIVLEHAIRGKAADPQKQSVNPLQSVVLESEDLLARLTSRKQLPGIDVDLAKKIRENEEIIEQELLGSSRLGYLTATLGLQRFEERTIVLALAPELDAKYAEIYAYLQDSLMRVRPTIDLALQLFSTHPDDRVAFSTASPLMRSRLLLEHNRQDSRLPMSQRTLSLDDRVLGFLLESPNIDYEIETWATLVPLPKDPPRAPIPREVLEKTTRMARECYGGGEAKQRPIFHLLGRTGSGRRALAEIACREAGVPLLVADMAAGGSARDKAESMWRLGRESLLQNAAILVENFDQLLEEESKPAMTAFLETIDDFGSPMVFLSGTQEWRPSALSPERPFVSISVPVPSPRERIVLWNEHLGPQHRLKPAEVAALAGNFDFTDGQIRYAIRAVSYHSGTRRVAVELQDGSRFEYSLPVPVRPGVRRREEKSQSRGRTPRISRLMALAIHFEGLVSSGAVRNYRELAEAGQVSRARLSQILQLTHLAPEIQEQLLFLPPTRQGFDRALEKHVRSLTRVVDWQKQKQLFRAIEDQLNS